MSAEPSSPMRTPCRGCGRRYAHLGRHLGKYAACREHYYVNFDSDDEDIEWAAARAASASQEVDDHFQEVLDGAVFQDLASFAFDDLCGETHMARLRTAVSRWNDLSIENCAADLSVIVGEDDDKVKQIMELLRKRFNTFKNLSSEHKLIAKAYKTLPVLRVVENRVGPDPEDKAYGELLLDWAVELFNVPHLRKLMYQRSERWKTGAMLEDTTEWTDFDNGTAFKPHPFAQKALNIPGEPIEVRIAVMDGYDDLELLNVLGVQRGVQKQACHYGACGNLPPEVRFEHDNLIMLLICPQKIYTKCDPVRVFSGADPVTGVPIHTDWASPGSQFRAGMVGHRVQVYTCTLSRPTQDRHACLRCVRIHRPTSQC